MDDAALPFAPRAVRIIALKEDGTPVHSGLFIVEVGTRLVFTMRPNTTIDLVRKRSQ